jgi:signal transduction histidine kinase/ActR/RegA family two-component response regulator
VTGPAAADRIAVLAPPVRDGPRTVSLLGKAGFPCVLARDVEELCLMISEGAAAAFVAEEVLAPAPAARLRDALAEQEPWSDLPVVVFTAPGAALQARRPAVEMLAASGNVTFLDRPVQTITLVSAARAALRARARQYATRDLLDRLAASVRTRDQFLAMLGHELRNPISAIAMASELIERGSGKAGWPAAVVSRQARKLSRLVDDLLEVSRIASGKITLQRCRTDLREAVERSIESTAALASAACIAIEASSPADPVEVDGDPVRLEQVIGNLLANSVKFTPRGGRVTVAVEDGAGAARVRVRDTGVGIAPEMLERIFEPFTQASAPLEPGGGGLGLGLALVRGLVELHGGKVRALSEGHGCGAELVVELPLARGGARAVRAPLPRPADSARRRVVVVEDNPDNRETLVMLLELLGHDVSSAEDGPSGARAILDEQPEVAIVDIGLPGFDGYEVARRVRSALGADVTLIALTGYGQAEDRERARVAGFDVHLTKPADADTVARAVACGRPAEAERIARRA